MSYLKLTSHWKSETFFKDNLKNLIIAQQIELFLPYNF